jgi:hypothetical protein
MPSRCIIFFSRKQYPHHDVVYMVTAVGAALIGGDPPSKVGHGPPRGVGVVSGEATPGGA